MPIFCYYPAIMITYLAKIGELTLKGSNLHEFEKLLLNNARRALDGTNAKASLRAGRLYIDCEDADSGNVETELTNLLGITGWEKRAYVKRISNRFGKRYWKKQKAPPLSEQRHSKSKRGEATKHSISILMKLPAARRIPFLMREFCKSMCIIPT